MSLVRLPTPLKLLKYSSARKSLPGVITLSDSDMDSMKMSDLLELADPECKAMWDGMNLGYRTPKGDPLLREEIGKLHGVGSEDVLTIGPKEGIFIATTCLVAYLQEKHKLEKFHVIAPYPGYQPLFEHLKSLHHLSCEFEAWPLRYTDSGWTFHLDELKNLIRGDTKLLIVNFPHNPTGYVPDDEEWKEIFDICKEKGIFVFSDEMYRLTNNDGSQPLASACAMNENAVSLFGMSKTFGLPGLRVGWLCTKDKKLLSMMQNLKDYISMSAPGPTEVLALIALRNKDKLLEPTIELIKRNLELADAFMKKRPDIFEWNPPRACSTGFLELKGWLLHDVGGGTATGVCDALLDEAKVLMVPASIYDYDDRFVRFNFAKQHVREGLERIENFLNEKQSKKTMTVDSEL